MLGLIKKSIKKVFGIENLTLYKQKRIRYIHKFYYREKYNAYDLVQKMIELGMKKGSIVFIHSSMTQFYNYTGSVEEFIDKIIEVIGDEGTILMPAYPKNKAKLFELSKKNPEKVVFDVINTPSGAGYMSEVFRKKAGVKRSINLQHSVCAMGRDADYFISEHFLSETAWDMKSPYYKLCKTNAIIFKFGLPNFIETILHCTESLLCEKYQYFSLFFQDEITYKYCDSNNNIATHSMRYCNIQRKPNNKRIRRKYLEPQHLIKKTKLSNLLIESSSASEILDEFLKLANNGITIYTKPDPRPYIKEGRFIEC